MFPTLTKLWAALSALASSAHNLAGVLDAAAGKLRQHLALEPEDVPLPALERKIDAEAPADAADADGKGRKNGRAKQPAA